MTRGGKFGSVSNRDCTSGTSESLGSTKYCEGFFCLKKYILIRIDFFFFISE